MKLNAPRKPVWWIALILVAIGVVARFVHIPYIGQYNFWFVVAGYVLLCLATFIKGL